MKETVATEYSSGVVTAPEGLDAGFAASIRARSQIVWGEHCSECAYPSCYSLCSFYDPRPDLDCRRFVAGIEAVTDGEERTWLRIRFRRWGKLEGHGPAPLRATASAERRERADAAVSRTLAALPLPFAVQRNAAWRWNIAKARATRDPWPDAPDAFVVEGWSNDGRTHGFTLTFLQDQPRRAMFQAHFELTPRLGRLSVPTAAIAREIDLAQPYLVQIEPVGEAEGIDAVFGLTDFVALAPAETQAAASAPAPAAASLPLAKVLVWDLDETLWTGTLAEDGEAGVTPRPGAVEIIKALDARGVLQSVASKNDHAEALAALRRQGLDEYFLHPQVNWGPKSQSVARIAAALDLGLDSFVFIDDQPFERAEVQAAHPVVRTLAHTQLSEILGHAWFDHPATPEAAQRRRSYQSEAQRTAAFEAADTDYLGFLRSSGLDLRIAPLTGAEVTRVFELSQRTNQLNFTGAKFDRPTVQRMAEPDPGFDRLTMRCADRFGDYGLIGFAELDRDAGELANFFMSCRVQRKRVEHALFAELARRLAAAGHERFVVRFRPTERNGASARLLAELGFAPAGEDRWTRPLATPFADAEVVRLTLADPAAARLEPAE